MRIAARRQTIVPIALRLLCSNGIVAAAAAAVAGAVAAAVAPAAARPPVAHLTLATPKP